MSRYIDAENLKEQIGDAFCDSYRLIQDIIEVIKNSPTADVVEVVRCKDCIYKQNAQINSKGFLICPVSGMEITDDDYAVMEKGKTNELSRLCSLCCLLESKRSGNGKSIDNKLSYLPSIQI